MIKDAEYYRNREIQALNYLIDGFRLRLELNAENGHGLTCRDCVDAATLLAATKDGDPWVEDSRQRLIDVVLSCRDRGRLVGSEEQRP